MKRNLFFLLIGLLGLLASCGSSGIDETKIQLKTNHDTICFLFGEVFANELLAGELEINEMAVLKGIKYKLQGIKLIPDSVKEKVIKKYNNSVQLAEVQEQQKIANENKQKGAIFLSENRNREGVQVTSTGLQYKIIKAGNGPKPLPEDSVIIHYRASFIDGNSFDESYGRGPQGIVLTNIIPGLTEGICLMSPGAIYEFYIPSDLGYGDQTFANTIPGGSTLIYRVELFEIH